ncbi:MAG: TonB-dependent receptor, partial [Candidatus Symbiothrix sp.]|nr:TonB-dependent receptor [Candidatus Symbiothrix sp.]
MLTVCVVCAFADNSYAQNARITLNKNKVALSEVLDEIEKQTDYLFIFNDQVDVDRIVSVKAQTTPVGIVLDKMLADTDVEYAMSGTHIVLTKQGTNSLSTSNLQQQEVRITGTVTDVTGEPIIGATVKVKGSSIGTSTGVEGKFSISVSGTNTILVFSYIGFVTQEVDAAAWGGKDLLIKLLENDQFLEEVVVVGFQTQKKVNLTGAVSTVSAETFENRPVANIGQALQGVVPNLNIGIANGAPNTVPSFNIRGGTSIGKDSDGNWVVTNDAPLILVDGVEVSPTMLNQMNPNDIESMSVIKDASAAAIYGTKATFGVILISTKSGKFGQKGKISYSYDLSWDTPSALPDILDAYTIQKSIMDKSEWTGGSVGSADRVKLEAIQKYMNDPRPENAYYMDGTTIIWAANMNPYKVVVRDRTPTQKHNVNFSGGTEKMAYYLSVGYQDQEGMYKINTDEYKRYNATVRINAKIKEWFNIDAKATYNQTNYETPYLVGGKGNLWAQMRAETGKNINMPITTSPNDPIPNAYTDNILAWISYGARINTTSTTTLLSVSPEFIIIPKVLKAKADLSYTPQSTKSTRRSPKHDYVNISWANTVAEQAEAQDNRARLLRNSTDTYVVNAYLDFNKSFAGKHNVSAIAGFSQENVEYGETVSNLRGLFSPDIMKPTAVEDITLNTIETDAHRITGRAAFGRINYNFAERYLFEVNGRYDGSSRFTPNERYFFFPSFSAGWRISEESFMESTKSWLNNLKIRGSWGKLGSQPGDYYPYQALMSSESAGFIIDGKYVTAVKVPGLVSPTLTWEKATTTNLGIDAAFLHNRLNLSFEIYERKTTDILTNGVVAYPSTLGASAPLENSGSIKAKGFELALQWKDKLDNGLRYSAEFTLYDARTKVLHYAANPTKNIGILYDGAYLNDIWGYETGGILQEADLVKNASGTGYTFNGPYHPGTNFYPGYIWYRDINGDGQINAGTSTVDNPGDRRVIGNSTPRYRYGFTGNVYYKGFDLNFFIQGVGKRDLWIGSNAYWGGGAGSQWMYDRSWTPERTDAEFPMYTATVNTQTKYLFNAAYLRLKQMVLGYTLLYSKYIDGHQNSWAYDRVAPFYDVQGSPIIFSDLFSDNMV